jgi:hypothetical protein
MPDTTSIFDALPRPARIPKSAVQLERVGHNIFKLLKRPATQQEFQAEVGQLPVSNGALPYVEWGRFIPEFVHVRLYDRRPTMGGFALTAIQVPESSRAYNSEMYIFGDSGTVHGMRKLIEGKLAGVNFKEELLRSITQSRLNLPAYEPPKPEDALNLSRAIGTLHRL